NLDWTLQEVAGRKARTVKTRDVAVGVEGRGWLRQARTTAPLRGFGITRAPGLGLTGSRQRGGTGESVPDSTRVKFWPETAAMSRLTPETSTVREDRSMIVPATGVAEETA